MIICDKRWGKILHYSDLSRRVGFPKFNIHAWTTHSVFLADEGILFITLPPSSLTLAYTLLSSTLALDTTSSTWALFCSYALGNVKRAMNAARRERFCHVEATLRGRAVLHCKVPAVRQTRS